jgi:hypothetical protein
VAGPSLTEGIEGQVGQKQGAGATNDGQGRRGKSPQHRHREGDDGRVGQQRRQRHARSSDRAGAHGALQHPSPTVAPG